MNNDKIKNILKEVLTELEIKVYLASLEGPLTIQQLAKKANLNRSGTYRIVENLINKGLLSRELKQHGQRIIAEHPKKVIQLLGKQQRNLRKKELAFEELLPEVLGGYNVDEHKPQIKIYEGIEGFKNIMEQIINILNNQKIKEYKVFAPTDEFLEMIKKYCPEIIKKRIKLRVKMKLITSTSKLAKRRQQEIDKKELRQRKILPKESGFESVIILFSNQLAIFNLDKEVVGLIVEDRKINKTLNSFFEFMWEKI